MLMKLPRKESKNKKKRAFLSRSKNSSREPRRKWKMPRRLPPKRSRSPSQTLHLYILKRNFSNTI